MQTINILQPHPVANIFPLMSDEEFTELKEDIRINGQAEPIYLYQSMILDGRNRYRACCELNIEPKYKPILYGEKFTDPITFVLSLNLKRRHLNSGQRAFVVLEIEKLYAEQAKKRQGIRTDIRNNIVEKIPPSDFGKSRDKAAVLVGTNAHYVSDAKKIAAKSPEIAEEIKTGKISITEGLKKIGVHVSNNSGNDEWYTPPNIIEKVHAFLGAIDYDPASSEAANKTVRAKIFYTAEDDGLKQDWSGRVFLNPPYSQPFIAQFSDLLVSKFCSNEVEEAILLVNNATETDWFQNILKVATAVCFPDGRIRFVNQDGKPGGTPLQGQAIIYLGNHIRVTDFINNFGIFGEILCRFQG